MSERKGRGHGIRHGPEGDLRAAVCHPQGDPVEPIRSYLAKANDRMGGLRAGWIMGPPDIIRRATTVMDLLQVNDPYPMVTFIEAAFDHGLARN